MICTIHQIFLGGQIKEDRMGGARGLWVRKKKTQKGLVGKPQEKRQFGTPRCRWLYNIKVGHEYILWEVMDWIHKAEDI